MYQIKTDSRLEMQVNGDKCKIVDGDGNVKFEGDYDACLKWLADRGIKTRS